MSALGLLYNFNWENFYAQGFRGKFVSAFWASIAYLALYEGFYWRLGRILAVSACLVS
jgi:hypothetical protein